MSSNAGSGLVGLGFLIGGGLAGIFLIEWSLVWFILGAAGGVALDGLRLVMRYGGD